MKKKIYSALCLGTVLLTASCSDFLETSSPSVVDADFVFSNTTTARAAMEGGYEQWRATCNSYTYGAGLFYASDIAGSDIERHPEAYSNQVPRHIPEGLYENGAKASTYDIDSYSSNANSGAYVQLYDCIGKANAVITAMESAANYDEMIGSATKPNSISQLYGEAIALRAASYRELIKYYGDVPFVKKFGVASGGLTARDSIYDYILADLKRVAKVDRIKWRHILRNHHQVIFRHIIDHERVVAVIDEASRRIQDLLHKRIVIGIGLISTVHHLQLHEANDVDDDYRNDKAADD